MAKRSNPAMKIAQETAHNAMFDAAGKPKPGLHNVLLRAVEVQRPLVLANIRRLQRRHPQATAAQLAAILERDYLLCRHRRRRAGRRGGRDSGRRNCGRTGSLGRREQSGSSKPPHCTPRPSLNCTASGMVDPRQASTLVMAIMLGEEGTAAAELAERTGRGPGQGAHPGWTAAFARRVPLAGFGTVRERIQTMFLRSLLKTQGTAWLGRALPFGIGAVVGGVGNRVMGHAVVANAKEAFGPMPGHDSGRTAGPCGNHRPGRALRNFPGAQPDRRRRAAAPGQRPPGRRHPGQRRSEDSNEGRRHVLDLNTDLGESFGTWTKGADAAMFPLVTSASVACGLHAGDPVTMLDTCRAAYELDVNVGAHIGYPDLAGFGLRSLDMTFDDLFGAVLYQLGALDGVAHAVGASVDYVKLHGALYDRTVHDGEQASAVIAAIQAYDPGLPVLGFPGSALLEIAKEAGHPVFSEAFADRAYFPDGTLVPRTEVGAVMLDAGQVAERAVRLATKGEIEAVDGTVLRIEPQSLCLQGDTPGSVAAATAIRAALEAAGVELESFA